MPLLAIDHLSLSIGGRPVLHDVSLGVESGKVLGIVGESGSGKSMTAMTIMRLLPYGAEPRGSVIFDGRSLLSAREKEMCRLRGNSIGMVFQEPMTALNPLETIGRQVAEGIIWHTGLPREDAMKRAARMLERVGLPQSQFPLTRYPHQLSGGQRQRVVIAIACALGPGLLIADEPTTALDVVLQARILELLQGLVAEDGMGLILISHDLAVVAGMADDIAVMKDGRVVEEAPAARLLKSPRHPYTRQLFQASSPPPAEAAPPVIGRPGTPLLAVQQAAKIFTEGHHGPFARARSFTAVDGVSFTMEKGHSLALVGRSGCGKSTLSRMILGLERPSSGRILFAGQDVSAAGHEAERRLRRDMQIVFQDPYGSFNPRRRVEWLVAEPLHLLGALGRAERRERVAEALRQVGLAPDMMRRYPHEFSGGQRQRLAIARAIITQPKLVVADEAVSALDVSARAMILDLFAELRGRLGLSYLFVSHDLTVVRAVADEVMVMDSGRIVERGATRDVLSSPKSDAGRALVAAAPDLTRIVAAM